MALAVSCARPAMALGEEDFGNSPLNAANFNDWPQIMPVVNHTSRVYHTWVNGNEHFYYAGDVAALNDALRKYAGAGSPVKEVVLRPGPGEAKTFDGKKTVKFNWNLHLTGGIAKHLTTLDKGDRVWSQNPVLTVYVDKDFPYRRLTIPNGLKVQTLSDLKLRVREGLTSTDKTVRGWGAGELAALDPYDPKSLEAIAKLLKDPDDWVRLNAAGVLPLFGSKAKAALPALRETLTTGDAQLLTRVKESIAEIEKAESRADAEAEHWKIDSEIRAMTGARSKG
jgi:hypothetical protein